MACLTLSVFLSVFLHLPWQIGSFSLTSSGDGKQLEVCEGQPIVLPWRVRQADGERLEDFDFYHLLTREPVNNTDLSQYSDGDRIDTTVGRFAVNTQNYHLYISRATINDSGIYTLVVRVTDTDRKSKYTTYKSKMILSVTSPPKTDGRSLQLEPPEAVKVGNGPDAEFHVVLSCGKFADPGLPPVEVNWRSPSGTTLSSTSFQNGSFRLVLPISVEIGKYACWVNPASPALRCAGTNDMARTLATGLLSREQSQFLLLQSAVNKLQSQLQSTQTELQRVTSAIMSTSCRDLRGNPNGTESGVRTLNIHGQLVNVYCDQTTDGGGWAVIQRRENGQVDFYRGWDDYVRGFGQPRSEYWLGLRHIHYLTADGTHELRVDLWNYNGEKAFAHYRRFKVEGADDDYRLRVSHYNPRSTAGDSMDYHNNMAFSTHDRDNDRVEDSYKNCAKRFHGAWWYKSCYYSNLNGRYRSSRQPSGSTGIVWNTWQILISLTKVEMRIRPV